MKLPTHLDVGKDPMHVCRKYRVFLDGKEVKDCTIVDTDKGYIVQNRRHPLFNKYLLDRKGNITTRRREGKVHLELINDRA